MAQKVVQEVVDFEKVVDLFNHTSFPAHELQKAFEVKTIFARAQLMDITPAPAPETTKVVE
jgi:hypothetical protein